MRDGAMTHTVNITRYYCESRCRQIIIFSFTDVKLLCGESHGYPNHLHTYIHTYILIFIIHLLKILAFVATITAINNYHGTNQKRENRFSTNQKAAVIILAQ
jgi:hypothetical protein